MAEEHEVENSVEVEDKSNKTTRKTIFVRNLPFTTTNETLENEFSNYGPIKKAFVVKDKDNISRCRGFGYVQFVLQDDSDKAATTPKTVDGRLLRISFADKKPKHEKRKKERAAKREGVKEDPNAEENNTVEFNSVENKEDKEEEEEIKDGQPLKPKKKKKKKKNVVVETKAVVYQKQSSNQVETEFQRTVVLTGLTEKVKRKTFRVLCETFGEIENIVYPVPEREVVTAFIRFKDIKGAVRASQKLTGKKIRKSNVLSAVLLNKENKNPSKAVLEHSRIIVRNISFKCEEADLRNCFSKYGKIMHVNIPTKIVRDKSVKIGCAFIQFDHPKNAQIAIKEMNLKKIKERPVVVDWAISKEKYEEQKSKAIASNVKEEDNEEESIEEKEDDEESEQEESEQEDDEESEQGMDEEEEEEKPRKQLKDAKEGKTIFIRNLAYETEEEMLSEEFEKYGDIAYCKIVMDDATGRSKGSAFIKFSTKKSADECLKEMAALEEKGKGMTVDGRKLLVSLGQTRGQIMEIERTQATKNKETDKRNLSLAYEGLITKNTPGADELSEQDLKRREKALADKKHKLKDPNYFVSRTRLCFRNLPLTTDGNELRKTLQKLNTAMVIKSIKIMRSKEDRKDTNGNLRSLGFGFVEIEEHDHALNLLRATNNNPKLFAENRRPIVEFAIENLKALQILEKRNSKVITPRTESEEKEFKARKQEKWNKRVARFKQRREDKKKNKSENKEDTSEKKSVPVVNVGKKENTLNKQNKTLFATPSDDAAVDKSPNNNIKRKSDEATENVNNKRARNANIKDEKKFNDLINVYKKKIIQKDSKGKSEGESRWFE